MRVLFVADPRWWVLLLVPVLLAAGTLHPEVVASRARMLLAAPDPAPEPLPSAGPDARPAVTAPAGTVLARTASGRRQGRASRAARDLERGVERSSRPPVTVQERGAAALRALGFDPATLGYRVRFLPYRGGQLGTTNRLSRLITVYVQRGQSELTLRATIAHELGHALDFVHGTEERRSTYREVRRLPDGPWFPCNRCSDFASPAGDFAEVFALWLAGPGDFRSRLAGPPSAAQLRELEPLLVVPEPAMAGRRPEPSPSPSPRPSEGSGLPALLGPPPSPAPHRH